MPSDNLREYLAYAVAIGTIILAWLKLRQESPATKVDVATKYQQMALNSASNEARMKTRIDELEARLDAMDIAHAQEIREVKAQLAEAEEYIGAMDRWAAQVLSAFKQLGITSLTPKPERKQRAAG
jgi:phage shock protein A